MAVREKLGSFPCDRKINSIVESGSKETLNTIIYIIQWRTNIAISVCSGIGIIIIDT